MAVLSLIAVVGLVAVFVSAQNSSNAAPAQSQIDTAVVRQAMVNLHTSMIESECELLEPANAPAYCTSPVFQAAEVETRISEG